jgi:hypothetical protein
MTIPRKPVRRRIVHSTLRVAENLSRSALLLSICCMLIACEGASPDAPAESKQESAPVTDPTEIAKRTVADFLSLPTSEITPVSMESKNFGDASLDCPVAGMAYAQVITPGHRVVVEAEGRRFDVRVSGGSGRICRKPAGPVQSLRSPPERSGAAQSATR